MIIYNILFTSPLSQLFFQRIYLPTKRISQIAHSNIDLSKQLQRKLGSNDTLDKVANNLIPFEPRILINVVRYFNLGDTAIVAIYTLTPSK
jgi:hypothetical protein